MNATELEMIRQQSDAMTLIGTFLVMCVFFVGSCLTDN